MTELASYNIVGHATPRAEGPDKVTGLGKYGMDRAMPGMLWCKILRSPFAHARIVSIDTTEAANMPGVHMVLTGKDMEGVRTNRSTYKDEPALCWDTVLYVGDKVAAVVADDEDIAERALGAYPGGIRGTDAGSVGAGGRAAGRDDFAPGLRHLFWRGRRAGNADKHPRHAESRAWRR